MTNTVNILDLFKKGYSLTNAASWKTRQNKINNLVTFIGILTGIASLFGYNISIDPTQLPIIITFFFSIFGVFNTIVTTITSTKVGFFNKNKL